MISTKQIISLGVASLLLAAPALSQDAEKEGDPAAPEHGDGPQIDEAALEAATKTPAGELTRDRVAEALRPSPDGLRAEQVVTRAQSSSPSIAAGQAELRAAAARVDQAYAAYFPRVTLGASYTRVSRVPSFDFPLPPGTLSDESDLFPVIVNQYALTASLEVPISDYLLRLSQAYAAVSNNVGARQLAIDADKLQIEANAKIAYYNWVRAHGHLAVAKLAVALADRHLADARITERAGLIAGADVLRLEAQKAQAEHLMRASQAFGEVAAEQLRTLMHDDGTAPLAVGMDITAPVPKTRASLATLKQRALDERLDVKSLRKAKVVLGEVEAATRASYYPRLAAFANGMYANPNPRIFPQAKQWDFTWDVGVRLTWTVNDTFTTIGAVREAEAKSEAVGAQLRALEDGIRMSVTAAYYDEATAHSALVAARERERATTGSLEARRKLFRGGHATATDIVDVEVALTEARLQRVDAHVDVLVARAKLEHAVGGPVR